MFIRLLNKFTLYELRNGYLLVITFPFIFAISYILSFIPNKEVEVSTFNTTFWLCLYFIANFICNISVLKQRKEEIRFFFLLSKPLHLVFAKTLINFVYILLSLFVIGLLNHTILFANNLIPFIILAVLFSFGISVINTFTAYLSVFTGNSYVISGIANLPMIIPFMLITIKISQQILTVENGNFNIQLISLGIITIAISSLIAFLMEYIWRE